jgi:hypothetical protein
VPGTVTVAGTISLGATLTAQPKGWPAGTTFTYAWRRNGIAIPAATTSRYRLVPDDDYATLSVRVVATVSGYDRTSATATAFVAGVLRPAPFASHPAAVIHGTMRSGSFAYAAVAPWTPAVSRLTYQWRRDGRNIDGADRRTYWLKGTDRGHLISAVVVGSRDGYVTTIVHGAARRVS